MIRIENQTAQVAQPPLQAAAPASVPEPVHLVQTHEVPYSEVEFSLKDRAVKGKLVGVWSHIWFYGTGVAALIGMAGVAIVVGAVAVKAIGAEAVVGMMLHRFIPAQNSSPTTDIPRNDE